MTRVALAVLVLVVSVGVPAALVACSSDGTTSDHTSGPADDAGTDADIDTTEASPNGGRDTKPSSCFAACGNSDFACATAGAPTAGTAHVVPVTLGCTGTLTTDQSVTLSIDCSMTNVCHGDSPGAAATTCAPGSFSAFSFAYTSAAGVMTVCTRE